MTSDPIGDIENAQGRQLLDRNGQPLGQIREIFLDEATGQPAWAAVDAPGGGDDLVLAPLAHSTREGDAVRVAVTREQVETSPSTSGLTERFSPEHMDRVRAHYADQPDDALTGTGGLGGDGDALTGTSGFGRERDTVATGELPPSIVRSEEELFVERERVPRERVRLVKRIVVETVTQTIEVRREELHVERVALAGSGGGLSATEPSTAGQTAAAEPGVGAAGTASLGIETGEGTAYSDAGASGSRGTGEQGGGSGLSALRARASSLVEKAGGRFAGGHGFGEPFNNETLDLTLYEEQIVISKRVVPRERVRIHREVVIEPQRITDDLRKERVEVERIGLDAETRDEGTYRPDTAF
jgi:stress response protein YsnF